MEAFSPRATHSAPRDGLSLTLDNGTIPNTLFSAKWFRWSSVLGVQMRHQHEVLSPGQGHILLRDDN